MNREEQSQRTGRAASESAAAPPPALRKELNLFDTVAIVVGTTIGSGIFLLPSSIAGELNTFGAVLLVWVLGGTLSVFGALSLAELGAIYPGTGGLCTYLRHAYGPFTAFLYAWGLLFMIHSGSIAALAVAFGLYARQILPLSPFEQKLLSVACVLVFTTISCAGIRGGKLTQNLIASAKVGGLAGIILLLCIRGSRPIQIFGVATNTGDPRFSASHFGMALVAVLFAYEGWHVVSFVAGEMKKPQTDLPRGLFYGTALIMLIYLTANFGYYRLLSPAQIRGSTALAAFAVGVVLGPVAKTAVSILIVISILGSINGLVLTGPRVYLAMAHDGVFPRALGHVNDRYRTPMIALIVQGVWAASLAFSGSYQQLFTDVIFTAWIFYGLAVAAVLVLRRTQPHVERPFCVPGYPWVSLLFCAAAIGVALNTLMARPSNGAIGIGLLACGVPIYILFFKPSTGRRKKSPTGR